MTLPGDPAKVGAAATVFGRAAASAMTASGLTQSAGAITWTGEAAGTYRGHAEVITDDLTEVSAVLTGAASALWVYQAALAGADADAARARARWESARNRFLSSPPDLTAIEDAFGAAAAFAGAAARAQQAAQEAASALLDLVKGKEWAQQWWDETTASLFGLLERQPAREVRVSEGLLEYASFDPDAVAQRGIGDCYLLSSLMGFMATDAGDAMIRQNIRWDEARGGYWVTLYDDGEPQEYFVDHVFAHGVKELDPDAVRPRPDQPNIASLYEAALSQHLGYRDFDDGGWPSDAMSLITGQEATDYDHGDIARNVEALRGDLAQGASVVAATGSAPTEEPRVMTVDVRDDRGGIVTTQVEIVDTHAYQVVDVESDGSVWVRNPWGQGNSADQGQVYRLSPDEFSEVFWRVSASEWPS